MSITNNLYYTGEYGSARAFVSDMIANGYVNAIRSMDGNLRYEYFFQADDPETVLLVGQWADTAALEGYHQSDVIPKVAALRHKYQLRMRAEQLKDVA